ncbi:MAG: transcriptional regulator [Marinobacter sp. T13-3]|jgi:hypothetical protein|nr:MAG: transcriptional regulator [Marinobacter sp. T13-3]
MSNRFGLTDGDKDMRIEESRHGSEIDINAVLDRVARLVDARNDASLAEVFGTSRQVLSGWRKRGTIPYEKLVELARDLEGVSLNYLLWGDLPASADGLARARGGALTSEEMTRRGNLMVAALDGLSALEALAMLSRLFNDWTSYPEGVSEAEKTSVELCLEGSVRSKIEQDPEIKAFIHGLRGRRSHAQIAEECRVRFGPRAPSRSSVGRYLLHLSRGLKEGGTANV